MCTPAYTVMDEIRTNMLGGLVSFSQGCKMYAFCDSCGPCYLAPSLGALGKLFVMNVMPNCILLDSPVKSS